MPKPLADFSRLLESLAHNSNILPATGRAVEELLHPDHEESQDAFLCREDSLVDILIEKSDTRIYVPTPPLPRVENHLLRYFLDGSIRTWFLGTLIGHQSVSPILLAQIGVAVVEREDDGRVHLFDSHLHHRLLLLIAKTYLPVGLWDELQQIASTSGITLLDILNEESFSPLSDLRLRASALGIARMSELEARTALQIADQCKKGWLVLDGSIRVKGLAHIKHTISIAKSFSKQPEFSFGHRWGGNTKSVLPLLADLPPEHRTAVFGGRNRSIAFWYVRLRDARHLDYPLMGIVKVEIPNPTANPVDSALIDEISRAVVAERNVTPYGADHRWHVHIYPIYSAEQAIKNRLHSISELRQVIRWPKSVHLI